MNAPATLATHTTRAAPVGSGWVGRFTPDLLDTDKLAQARGDDIDIPGLTLRAPRGAMAWNTHYLVLCAGRPGFDDYTARKVARTRGPAQGWLTLATRHSDRALDFALGAYALVLINLKRREITLATDRFATHSLCWRVHDEGIDFADRADVLSCDIEPQALFEYFHTHVISTPHTVYRDVRRLGPAGRAVFSARGLTQDTHWQPKFQDLHRLATDELAIEFRTLVKQAVWRHIEGLHTGCFLSGGTDSSTVAGMLSLITGARMPTYSIGFDVDGYDELAYAQLAAAHFDCAHHAYAMKPDDLLELIPHLGARCEQPFGNSSLAPAHLCARLAHAHGTRRLLAGDGGDEILGGNTRYAEQKIFDRWLHLPRWAQHLTRLAVQLTPSATLRRKAARFIQHAQTPMPARLERYNLLTHLGLATIFHPAFLQQVDTDAPARHAAALWACKQQTSLTDSLLAYDWQVTLADSDLPKVNQACALAGVEVGYPLLDDHLLDFSLTLAPRLKVQGLTLRYFFKYALRDFLPREILTKKKHGFGLPFGPWVLSHTGLRDFARDALDGLADRRIADTAFARDIFGSRLTAAPGYYGEIIWLMVMLEHWFRAHAPHWKL